MSEHTWEIPSLEEELTRKTLETYEWIVERSGAGEMSDAQVKVALQAVFNVTCGLVPKEITHAADICEGSADAKALYKRVFVSASKLAVISWRYGDETMRVFIRDLGSGKERDEEFREDSARLCLQRAERMAQSCLSMGLIEL